MYSLLSQLLVCFISQSIAEWPVYVPSKSIFRSGPRGGALYTLSINPVTLSPLPSECLAPNPPHPQKVRAQLTSSEIKGVLVGPNTVSLGH